MGKRQKNSQKNRGKNPNVTPKNNEVAAATPLAGKEQPLSAQAPIALTTLPADTHAEINLVLTYSPSSATPPQENPNIIYYSPENSTPTIEASPQNIDNSAVTAEDENLPLIDPSNVVPFRELAFAQKAANFIMGSATPKKTPEENPAKIQDEINQWLQATEPQGPKYPESFPPVPQAPAEITTVEEIELETEEVSEVNPTSATLAMPMTGLKSNQNNNPNSLPETDPQYEDVNGEAETVAMSIGSLNNTPAPSKITNNSYAGFFNDFTHEDPKLTSIARPKKTEDPEAKKELSEAVETFKQSQINPVVARYGKFGKFLGLLKFWANSAYGTIFSSPTPESREKFEKDLANKTSKAEVEAIQQDLAKIPDPIEPTLTADELAEIQKLPTQIPESENLSEKLTPEDIADLDYVPRPQIFRKIVTALAAIAVLIGGYVGIKKIQKSSIEEKLESYANRKQTPTTPANKVEENIVTENALTWLKNKIKFTEIDVNAISYDPIKNIFTSTQYPDMAIPYSTNLLAKLSEISTFDTPFSEATKFPVTPKLNLRLSRVADLLEEKNQLTERLAALVEASASAPDKTPATIATNLPSEPKASTPIIPTPAPQPIPQKQTPEPKIDTTPKPQDMLINELPTLLAIGVNAAQQPAQDPSQKPKTPQATEPKTTPSKAKTTPTPPTIEAPKTLLTPEVQNLIADLNTKKPDIMRFTLEGEEGDMIIVRIDKLQKNTFLKLKIRPQSLKSSLSQLLGR